jgi:nucleoside-diphosphate-sugar epimerase
MIKALAYGHEVIALRRSSLSRPVIPVNQEPTWLNCDLVDLTPDLLRGCDVVIHLASSGVSPKQATWNELIDVNALGPAHLIATAHEAGVSRFIVAGTCHEYGASANHYRAIPVTAPLVPLTQYGASKAAGFHLLCGYARCHHLSLYYGRIFNAFGEGQYCGNFWPSLRDAAIAGTDFPMTMGKQIRDFVPVESVAEILLNASTIAELIPGIPCIKNIGTGRSSSLLDFARNEWQKFNASGIILPGMLPERPDEIQRLVPDI